MIRRALLTLLVLLVVATVGCKPPEKPPALVVSIRVLDESKAPIDGAEIALESKVLARTDAEGRATLNIDGKDDGTTFPVEVRCPAKVFRSPTTPIAIRRLRSVGEGPEYIARCERLRHQLTIAIKIDGGMGNMPVVHLGKEVARTDQHGKATVLVEGEVRERIELVIDTSDPKYAKLHPQNPSGAFEIGGHDETKPFEVKFTRDKPPPPKIIKKQAPKAL